MNKKIAAKILITLAIILPVIILYACTGGGQTEQTEPPEITESPSPTPVPRDVSGDTPLAASMVYANELANKVQGYYTTSDRDVYVLENTTMRLSESLTAEGGKGVLSFSGADGKEYFAGSMDTYVIDNSGNEWSDRFSPGYARVNTARLGYYYYESHFRDLSLGASSEDSSFESVTPITDLMKNGRANDGSLKEGAAGSVVFTVKSTYDPYLYIKNVSVAAQKVNAIEVTIAVKGSSSRMELFINDGSNFNQAQSLVFTVKADGQPHKYLIDISAIQRGGVLSGLRFDIGENIGDEVTFSSLRAVKINSAVPAVKVEKTYHVFSDKLHQEFRIVALEKVENVAEFGMIWRVDKSAVNAISVRDAAGKHADLNFDPQTVEYVAFDFKEAGICGIIVPNDPSITLCVTVEEEGEQYVVRQKCAGKLSLKKGGDAAVANRLYNDASHSFDAIEKEASDERTPLGADRISVSVNDSKTKYKYYDVVRGVYVFTLKGTTFSTAYLAKNNNKYFGATVTIDNDDSDRRIYINFSADSECLECAAILDGRGIMTPIPIEVCKNFTYEKEEPLYDPTDVPYSDTYFPLKLSGGESLTFTHMHLYQNWGKYPLKQLSSIQFHVSYYHLSTGVTESNCIAPYYVYGRDGWTLPDFRGPSGIMWSTQPQFTAGGHNKFVSYSKGDGNIIRAEYTGSNIRSYGPTYADLEYSYKADSGEYEYTLRHMEFPQTDENRTYYTVSLRFLKDTTFKNVAEELTLHYFDSRDQKFDKLSYTAPDGTVKTVLTDFSGSNMNTVKLSSGTFWFAYYGSSNKDCMNEALLMRNYRIVIGGKEWNGNFVLRNGYDGIMCNVSELSLDIGSCTFKKGDTIYLEFLLVPWGNTDHDTYSNIERLYEDSVLKPLSLSVKTGSVIEEPYLPHIMCEDNYAEFTVSGGRNNNVVRIDGFTSLERPVIEILGADGNWEPYVTNVLEYDGYCVHYALNGTYGYSFVFTSDGPDNAYTFRLRV
ncbi:MAG: hypothetical protein J5950_01250 [Clostridia bacterium]|nr:hypothetical protein [Clostridia bacterium]